MLTYHTITYTRQTTVRGEIGNDIVNLRLIRKNDNVLCQIGSRIGNGIFDWTWYDNTELMFIEADAGTNEVGRSEDFTF